MDVLEHPVTTYKKGGSFLLERHAAKEVTTPEDFSDELRMFAQTAQQFVEREIRPNFEKLEHLDYDLSTQAIRKAGEMGLLGLDVPEEYGGLNTSKVASILVTENISKAGSFNVTFAAHTGIGTLPLVYFGTPAQQEKYLPKLVTGEWIGAYCLTEPGSGSDSLAAKTKAVLNEAGTHYILNGTKMWISNAGFANLFTVFAKIDGQHFTAFLVERDFPGLSFGAEEKKMGIKGSSTRQVILENVAVPKENLLGEIGRGHIIAFQILNIGRLKLAAGGIGGSKEMIRLAAKYAQERQQFGQPIGNFGLIQEKIGKMTSDTFALESAIYRMTGELDKCLEGTKTQAEQLEAIDEYVVEYSFIKVAGSEILDDNIDETLQIFGGNGFSAEYPIELAYRNSRINRIFEGTNEINRLLTTGQLLKRALKGKLDVMSAAQAAIQGSPITDVDAPAELKEAALAIENMKRATLLVAGLGAMAYMQKLEQEQEITARVTDMITALYLAESALLRAEKMIGSSKAAKAISLAKLYTFEAVDRSRQLGTEALRRIPNGKAMIKKLQSYLPEHGEDLIEVKRQIAKDVYEAQGYLFA